MRASAALTISLLALSGCRPSAEDCRKLLDHFLDVEGVAGTQGQFRDLTEPLKQALTYSSRRASSSTGTTATSGLPLRSITSRCLPKAPLPPPMTKAWTAACRRARAGGSRPGWRDQGE